MSQWPVNSLLMKRKVQAEELRPRDKPSKNPAEQLLQINHLIADLDLRKN